MSRRKLKEKQIRKIIKTGNSWGVTIPIETLKSLKWKEKQKVVVKRRGKNVIITDWKAK